jgi:hypothetical protein
LKLTEIPTNVPYVLECLAVRTCGYKGIEVPEALSLSSPTMSRIVENGENIFDNNRKLGLELA